MKCVGRMPTPRHDSPARLQPLVVATGHHDSPDPNVHRRLPIHVVWAGVRSGAGALRRHVRRDSRGADGTRRAGDQSPHAGHVPVHARPVVPPADSEWAGVYRLYRGGGRLVGACRRVHGRDRARSHLPPAPPITARSLILSPLPDAPTVWSMATARRCDDEGGYGNWENLPETEARCRNAGAVDEFQGRTRA